MTETVLVTGATGFIGSALTARLASEGVRVLTMSSSVGRDVTRPSAFRDFTQARVDAVYHLAARTFIPASWDDPSDFYHVNTLGTQRVLEFCRAVGAPLIYCSAYVYGPPAYLPVDEQHPVLPSNPYAHSKWLGEELCRFYLNAWQVPSTIVRPFNVYGPGQDSRFVIPSIVRQWVRDEIVHIESTTPKRDFVYIADLVDALLVLGRGPFEGEVFNVGSGQSTSVRDVITTLERVVGRPVRYEERGTPRPDEIPEVVAGRRLIGDGRWNPSTSLEQGLAAMVDWERKHIDP